MNEAASLYLRSLEEAEDCHPMTARKLRADAAKLFRSAGYRNPPADIVAMAKREHRIIRIVIALRSRADNADEDGETEIAAKLYQACRVNARFWHDASQRLYARIAELAA